MITNRIIAVCYFPQNFRIDLYCAVKHSNSFWATLFSNFSLQKLSREDEGKSTLRSNKTDKLIFCVRHILFSIIFITSLGNLEIFRELIVIPRQFVSPSIFSFPSTFFKFIILFIFHFPLMFTYIVCKSALRYLHIFLKDTDAMSRG